MLKPQFDFGQTRISLFILTQLMWTVKCHGNTFITVPKQFTRYGINYTILLQDKYLTLHCLPLSIDNARQWHRSPVLTATVIQFKCSYKILLLRTTVHCYYYDLKEGQRRKKCLKLWTQLPEMLISLAPKTLINVYYNKIRFAELHPNKPQHFWIDWRLVKWYFSGAVMYSAVPGENQTQQNSTNA